MTPCDRFNGHEADIVPVMRVFRAGIAETHKEQHDAASPKFSLAASRYRELPNQGH
jgi:hypothetical protein